MAWVTLTPVKFDLTKRRVPSTLGQRLVLLKNGAPWKVLPASAGEVSLDIRTAWSTDGVAAINNTETVHYEFTERLWSADRVALSSELSVRLRAKEDDAALRQLAIGADKLLADLEESILAALAKKLREIPYDEMDSRKSDMEEFISDALAGETGEGSPFSIADITIFSINSKDPAIVSKWERERDQKKRDEEHQKNIADLRNKNALETVRKEHEQALATLEDSREAKAARDRAKAWVDSLRETAEINQKFGIAALPVQLQQKFWGALIEAQIALARNDTATAETLVSTVVNGFKINEESAREIHNIMRTRRLDASQSAAAIGSQSDSGDGARLDDEPEDSSEGEFETEETDEDPSASDTDESRQS